MGIGPLLLRVFSSFRLLVEATAERGLGDQGVAGFRGLV